MPREIPANLPGRPAPAERRGLALGRLEGILGFHIRMAAAAIYRDFAASLGPLELTQKQFAVLDLIAGNSEPSQADLGAALGMDRATMMALVDRLEGRGLLQRRRSTTDRRRLALALTPAGAELLTKAQTAVATHELRFTSRYDKAELEQLIGALRRLYRSE